MKCALPECKRKLKTHETVLKCRCNRAFCEHHRFFTDHACDVNYMEVARNANIAKDKAFTTLEHERGDNTAF